MPLNATCFQIISMKIFDHTDASNQRGRHSCSRFSCFLVHFWWQTTCVERCDRHIKSIKPLLSPFLPSCIRGFGCSPPFPLIDAKWMPGYYKSAPRVSLMEEQRKNTGAIWMFGLFLGWVWTATDDVSQIYKSKERQSQNRRLWNPSWLFLPSIPNILSALNLLLLRITR